MESPGRIVVFNTVGKFSLLTMGRKLTLTFVNSLNPPFMAFLYKFMIRTGYYSRGAVSRIHIIVHYGPWKKRRAMIKILGEI